MPTSSRLSGPLMSLTLAVAAAASSPNRFFVGTAPV
jgi:hypothetical protein